MCLDISTVCQKYNKKFENIWKPAGGMIQVEDDIIFL